MYQQGDAYSPQRSLDGAKQTIAGFRRCVAGWSERALFLAVKMHLPSQGQTGTRVSRLDVFAKKFISGFSWQVLGLYIPVVPARHIFQDPAVAVAGQQAIDQTPVFSVIMLHAD